MNAAKLERRRARLERRRKEFKPNPPRQLASKVKTPSERLARQVAATTAWAQLPRALKLAYARIVSDGRRPCTGSATRSSHSRNKRDPHRIRRRERRFARRRAIAMRSTHAYATAAGIVLDDVQPKQTLSDHTIAKARGITQRELRLERQEQLKPIIEQKLAKKTERDDAVRGIRKTIRRIRRAPAPSSIEVASANSGRLIELLDRANTIFRRRAA